MKLELDEDRYRITSDDGAECGDDVDYGEMAILEHTDGSIYTAFLEAPATAWAGFDVKVYRLEAVPTETEEVEFEESDEDEDADD